jgi:hypothetical protein
LAGERALAKDWPGTGLSLLVFCACLIGMRKPEEIPASSEPDLRTAKTQNIVVVKPHFMPLQSAAQIAYERAERDGWLEYVAGNTQNPAERLTIFKHMMTIQADEGSIILKGVRPPSTQAYPIPAGALRHLYPMKGENTLHETSPAGQVAYKDVTISAADLEKVIAIYRAIPAAGELPALPSEIQSNPPTMFDIFQSDFAGLTGKQEETTFTFGDGGTAKINTRLLLDFGAGSKFIAFFIPRSDLAARVYQALATQTAEIMGRLDASMGISMKRLGEHGMTDSKDLTFTGFAYLYCEESLSVHELSDLIKLFQANGLTLKIRDHEYHTHKLLEWHNSQKKQS